VRCARCEQENPPEARFCLHCGAALGRECSDCGAALPAGSRFCPECGSAVEETPAPATYTPRHLSDQILAVRSAIEGERKQVTVLFCDIVRSSALAAELGPEGFHRVVDRFFALALDEVHRYEGTINQFLGDGFMALFGAPIAHEDHPRRAVLAALGVAQRAEVGIRIGINTGPVVVGAIGDDLRMDYTAFGDTTVLAARLQAAAQPGDVLVSGATAENIDGYFDLEEIQPVEVKERTVHAFRVAGRGMRTSPIDVGEEHLSPFAGRSSELEALRRILLGVVEGEGQVVGLAGDPGLGKSRLAYEFRRGAEAEAAVLEGRCLPYGGGIAYLPILDLVRSACGIAPEDEPERAAARIAETLEAHGLDAAHALYLRHALGVGPEDEELAGLDPATIKGRTFEALRSLLLAKAATPLLLVVEDMHWIDRTSEEFLTELVDELPSLPLLLLTTSRPGYNPPWIGKSYAAQIALRPLSRGASEQVVSWILGDSDDAAVATIVSRGQGNPFFLEELARATRQQVDGGAGGVVPGTVQDVLAARIDQLDSVEKSAVQVAAVLGREFSLELLEQVWDGDAPVLSALQELKSREFLLERHGGAERTFQFKHALTQAVAYDALLEERRQDLHARAGAALERSYEGRLHEQYEVLAYHYSRSADRARAADYLELANRKAASRHGMEEALGYFYEAIAILESLPDSEENRRRRLVLVFDQTGEFHWLHRHDEFHELLLRHEPLALELGDPAVLGALYGRLSHRQLVFGLYEQARDTAEKALDLCERGGNGEDSALSLALVAWTNMMLGDYDRAQAYYRRARKQLEASFHPMWYMYVEVGAAIAYLMAGRWDEALRPIEDAAAKGAERSDNGIVSFATAFGSWVFLEKRDWASALEHANAAKEIAPTVYFRGFAFGFLASALCRTGAAEQGLPILEQIAPMVRASRHELAWIFVAWRLADAYLAAGDLARARETFGDILESAARDKVPFFLGGSGRGLAEIALAEGDAEAARRRLEPAIEALRASGSENELALALAAFGRTQRMVGDEGEARRHLEEALAIFDRLGTLEAPDRLRDELAAQAV